MGNPENSFYELKGREIFKRAIENKNPDGTTSITMGFRVCTVSEYVSADVVLSILERNEVNTELVKSLKDILDRFKSCLGSGIEEEKGNGQIEGDLEAIQNADKLLAMAEAK